MKEDKLVKDVVAEDNTPNSIDGNPNTTARKVMNGL
jgi:hypothetical protein